MKLLSIRPIVYFKIFTTTSVSWIWLNLLAGKNIGLYLVTWPCNLWAEKFGNNDYGSELFDWTAVVHVILRKPENDTDFLVCFRSFYS